MYCTKLIFYAGCFHLQTVLAARPAAVAAPAARRRNALRERRGRVARGARAGARGDAA